MDTIDSKKDSTVLPIFQLFSNQEKIDRTLEYSTPAWLDDIIVVTRGDRTEHEKLFDVLRKLQDAGYRASERKSEFFLNKTKWLGHEIDETGIKPNTEKVKAILDLKPPENQKQLKSFLGAIQYLAKFIPRLSERTERLRILLKKKSKWNWGKEQDEDFNNKETTNRRTLSRSLCKGQI